MNKQEIEKALKMVNEKLEGIPLECVETKAKYETIKSALEHQLTNGWIPVTTPPENNRHEHGESMEFNVMLRGGTVATTGCISNDGIWGWMDWCDLKFNPFGVDVLYWQPLPKAPEEVSE